MRGEEHKDGDRKWGRREDQRRVIDKRRGEMRQGGTRAEKRG